MIFVDIIGISILVIFFLFIFTKRKKITSDYLLMLIIAVYMLVFLSDILNSKGYSTSKYLFQILIYFFKFPIILAYGLVLISEKHKIKKEWWWIASFALTFYIFIIIDFTFLNDYDTPDKVKKLYSSPSLAYLFFFKGQFIFIVIALFWFLKKIKLYVNRIKNHYSSIESIHLNWFRNFIYLYLIHNLLAFITFLLFDFKILSNIDITYTVVNSIKVIMLFYLCYHGIKQYSLSEFNEPKELLAYRDKTEASHSKYKYSSLSEEEMNSILLKIKALFETDRIYLEPQLKIEELAKELHVTTHNISQTINLKAQKPFYDFVNEYRVNHFKKLLSDIDNRKFTILALGIESGFNSKATLNRVFKQNIGQSPKAFQKSHFIK